MRLCRRAYSRPNTGVLSTRAVASFGLRRGRAGAGVAEEIAFFFLFIVACAVRAVEWENHARPVDWPRTMKCGSGNTTSIAFGSIKEVVQVLLGLIARITIAFP